MLVSSSNDLTISRVCSDLIHSVTLEITETQLQVADQA